MCGPPGAGKGTQGARLAALLKVPHISTGEIFRAAVGSKTELGLKAQSFVDRGDLVPDELVNQLVVDRLRQSDVLDGVLLDGYPRTVQQAEYLDAELPQERVAALRVILLEVDDKVLRERLLLRSQQSGSSRVDDAEAVVDHRLLVYKKETAPLAAFYEPSGRLIRIDGVGKMEDVELRIANALPSNL